MRDQTDVHTIRRFRISNIALYRLRKATSARALYTVEGLIRVRSPGASDVDFRE